MTRGVDERLSYALHHLVAELDAHADRILAERYADLTFSQFMFLAVLEDGQPLDVTRMAECLGVTKAAVSKRVPGLVARGYVDARADPSHGRRVVLTLTDVGVRIAREAGGVLDDEFLRLFTEHDDLDLTRTRTDVLRMLDVLRRKGSTS